MIGAIEQRVGLLGIQSRRQNAVVEGEGRLDQAGDTRGRHGVADHRRDGTKEAMAMGRSREDGVQGLELGRVGGGHA